jgi:hypothetical protein
LLQLVMDEIVVLLPPLVEDNGGPSWVSPTDEAIPPLSPPVNDGNTQWQSSRTNMAPLHGARMMTGNQ